MEGYIIRLQKLWKTRTTRMVLAAAAVIFAVAVLQNFELTSGSAASPSLFSIFRAPAAPERWSPNHSPVGPSAGHDLSANSGTGAGVPPVGAQTPPAAEETEPETGPDAGGDIDLGYEDENPNEEFMVDLGDGEFLKKSRDGYITIEKGSGGVENSAPSEKVDQFGDGSISNRVNGSGDSGNSSDIATERGRGGGKSTVAADNSSRSAYLVASPPSKSHGNSSFSPPDEEKVYPAQSILQASNSTTPSGEVGRVGGKRMPAVVSMAEMNEMLRKSHATSRAAVPLWPSEVDEQILEAKRQIENAPFVNYDQELYPPIFRNFSMFKRSYELMERILKVYIYKEGERPIFHKPFLTSIYASEGWFMKQMEENTQFVTGDPSKAHLFYMPFSSRILQEALYVADSHSHDPLIRHLRSYVGVISSKYPFWNRTGGSDHFLAGCHDWATHETGRSMESSIRALCNADVREGFEIGKDVSLPETFVRYPDDPLRGAGGMPAHKRTTLAFFAGQMHGYLRPVLLQLWGESRDPDMKVFGPIPNRLSVFESGSKKKRKKKKKRKVTRVPYLDYMKSSRYCICPRGYEVNSPRIVEAIFYECVPVIISDNFVPPLFEVLDWETFSVVVAEEDVPRLKEILVSIPRRKYMALQNGVRMVQKHFLWNKEPVKYDLFHMILHSVWFNRVFRIRDR